MSEVPPDLHRTWRLLPSEQVLWHGTPVLGIPRDRRWVVIPGLFYALSAVSALFAGLVRVTDAGPSSGAVSIAIYLALIGTAFAIAPRFALDRCEFVLTDRRVLWRNGRMRRSMERAAITFGRITWHPSAAGIGSLELVRAVPFGPLSRLQRLVLHDVRMPDAVFALVRGVPVREDAGDPDMRLSDRLDEGEQLLWGGAPEGWMDWRHVLTAAGGVCVVLLAILYGVHAGGVILSLEEVGLRVQSWTWVLLFLPVFIAFLVILAVGCGLFWYGAVQSRALGRDTEYILTNRRLLIRRGRKELSVDRARIVDVALSPSSRGVFDLFLILDGPQTQALGTSGALGPFAPPRDGVPPVLYEVRDPEIVRELILDRRRDSRPSSPGPMRDAA